MNQFLLHSPDPGQELFSDFFVGDWPMRNERHRQEKIRHPPPTSRLVLRSKAASQSGMRSAYKIRLFRVIRFLILFFECSEPVSIIRHTCASVFHPRLHFRRMESESARSWGVRAATPETARGHSSPTLFGCGSAGPSRRLIGIPSPTPFFCQWIPKPAEIPFETRSQ
jgi:hypothetical protein